MTHSGVIQMGSKRPSRVEQFEQVKRALVRASFTLCWLPSVSLGLLYWAQGKTALPVKLFGMLALWYFVEYRAPQRFRNYLAALLALAILYAPIWESNPNARLWFAITVAGAATEIISALYVPWPFAFYFILITALIEHLVLVNQSKFLFSPGAHGLNDWVGPLWLIVLGSFVTFASHRINRTLAKEDRAADSLETLKARDAIARALSDEHASQQRRLHETVLNTLASLVRKDTESAGPLLNRLQDEIAQARIYQGLETPTTMSTIIGSVIPVANENDPQIEISDDDDILLSPSVARDVRDAVAELVRNSIKHSHGSHILISWKASDTHLRVTVSDDGVGLSENAGKGLGLGRILPEILRDRQATMTVGTNDGVGARIQLSIPLQSEPEEPIEAEVPDSLMEEFDSIGRLLLAAPALSVAALGWWLVAPYGPKLLLAGLLLLHVAVVLKASVNPRARGAWGFIGVGLVVGLVIIFIIATSAKTCSNIGQIRWAANFLYNSASLGLVFYAPTRFRPFLVLATASGLFGMSLFLPSACTGALLGPASALLGVYLVLISLWRQTDRWRLRVQLGERRSAEMTRRRIERRLSVYRADQWSAALDSLERFANAAATGSLVDGEVQRHAHIEEERLRARIQLDPFVNGSFAQMALDLVNHAAENNWTPTVTVVETFMNSQAIPERVRRALINACSRIKDGSCQITLYLDEDEECLTIVSNSLDVERTASEINLRNTSAQRSPNRKEVRAIFDTSEGEKWLEIRRSM